MVQNDIKRVVAYSTLSQLGYMTVALGVSAYAGGIFHLMTHAFFKALLFLGAGSVIIAMHHEQDMRNMGGLRKYMPITYCDDADRQRSRCAASRRSPASSPRTPSSRRCTRRRSRATAYAYFCVVAGVFVTAFYTFRLVFMTFHGKPRFERRRRTAARGATHAHDGHDDHRRRRRKARGSSRVPLIAARHSVGRRRVDRTSSRCSFGDFFGTSIVVLPQHAVLAELAGGVARRRRVHPSMAS